MRRWRILGALAATATLFTAVALATLEMARGEEWHTLPLPDPGQPLLTRLPDGQPVFVARHADGAVTVLYAVAPHSGEPLAWCRDARSFVEPFGASLFDERGRYAFGPAPTGVAAFKTRIRRGDVLVGPRRAPPPRWVKPDIGRLPVGSQCVDSEGAAGGVATTWDALPGPFAPHQIPIAPGFYQVDARVDVPTAGPLRLCRINATRCPGAVLVERGWGNNETNNLEHVTGRIEGRVLVRRTSDGALVDLVAPFSTTAIDLDRTGELLEGTATLHALGRDGAAWELRLTPRRLPDLPHPPCRADGGASIAPGRYRMSRYASILLPAGAAGDAGGWLAPPTELAQLLREHGRLEVEVCGHGNVVDWLHVVRPTAR